MAEQEGFYARKFLEVKNPADGSTKRRFSAAALRDTLFPKGDGAYAIYAH